MAHRVFCILFLALLGISGIVGAATARERAEIPILIVVYPETYTGQLTRFRVSYLHQGIADCQYWMRWALGATVDFQYDLVQVERPLGPYDFERDDHGRVRLGRAPVRADLAARGLTWDGYAGVLVFFAWNDVEGPIPSRLAATPYVDGRFASQGVFWPAEPQIGYPEHAMASVLEAAFAEAGIEGVKTAAPSDLEAILRVMADLVKRSPGYFASAGVGDDEITGALERLGGGDREAVLGRVREWGRGHVPHLLDKGMLRSVTPEQWLALADKFGWRVEAPASVRVAPLYRRIHGSSGSLIWDSFTAIGPDGASVTGGKGYLWVEESEQKRLNAQARTFAPTYSGDGPLFSYEMFTLGRLLSEPITCDIRVDVGDQTYTTTSEFLIDDVGMVSAPPDAVFWIKDPSRVLEARLVHQSYGYDDPPLAGRVTARIEPAGGGEARTAALNPSTSGIGYVLDLAPLAVGEYRVTLSGESDIVPVQDAQVHVAVLPWVLKMPEWVTCRVNQPVTITPHLVGDVGEGEGAAHAAVKPVSTEYVAAKETGTDGSLTVTCSRVGSFPVRGVAWQKGRLIRPACILSVNVLAPGVYEGEDMVADAEVSGGQCRVDRVAMHHPQQGPRWGNERQLLFVPSAAGDWVEVTVDVPEEADYAIFGTFCGGDEQGIFTVAVDGGPPGEPLDAYAAAYMLTEKTDLGEAHLTKGPHTLRFTVVDKAPESLGYAFGLDRLFLEKK
jgi:hypothetical protein